MSLALLTNEPLAKHNSWRVGGNAKLFFTPESIDALVLFLQSNTLPIYYLGLGSNVLFSDAGFNGVVISTKKLNKLIFNAAQIEAQAGVSLAKLARFANQYNEPTLAFFAGIPGTVGGALAMNAGAFGCETWQYVKNVTTIDTHGKLNTRQPTDFVIDYRSVCPQYNNEHFLSATFTGVPTKQLNTIKVLLEKRNATQPIGSANCGSVFKNPQSLFAAALIEEAGLKGHRIGGALVSDKHANFIINDDHASANDIKALIRFIQQQVLIKFAVKLETEVKIIL